MTQTATATSDHQTTGQAPHQEQKHRTPPGHRVLHLVIDQETFDLLHLCALRSRMKYTAFMRRFLKEAFPYDDPDGVPAVEQ